MRRATAATIGRPQSAASHLSSSSSRRTPGGNIHDVNAAITPSQQDAAAAPMEATMTCMSVVEEGSQIAFACYDEERNEILLEQGHAHGHDKESVVEGFLAVARPTLVLVSNKIAGNEPLLHLLTKPLADMENSSTTPTSPSTSRSTPYRLLKTGAFEIRNCRSLILSKLRVLSLLRTSSNTSTHPNQHNYQHHGRNDNRRFPHSSHHYPAVRPSTYNALASLVDFDSNIQVKALGSLLTFLQETIFRLEEGATVTVNTIRHAESSLYVTIDSATLASLHIFATEHHPIMARGHGHVKEGFSLFSLLDRTKSKVGRQCLRQWMLKPLLDPHAIARRHDGVTMCLLPEFQSSVGVLLNLLERIGAVDKILLRMSKCHTSPMDFIVLSRTLNAALKVCTTLRNDIESHLNNYLLASNTDNNVDTTIKRNQAQRFLVFLESILEPCSVPVMRDLHERILSIVDHDMTMESKDSVVIQSDFHEELDAAKESFEHLDETLQVVASEILERHPELKRLTVIFVPQVGFLVSLDKHHHRNGADDDDTNNEFPNLPQDFTFVFVHDNDAYFKNSDMVRLDDEIGDLDAFITDTESMIVTELEEDILDCETELRSTFSALAELDCILAFASCAADLNFTRPKIVHASECCIRIKNGRHPLQELIVDGDFIANDTAVDAANRTNIITGPNFSGKSCYTRQVGILVYMAHIGSYLPCESATISITDQIFARISAVETCSVPQSSFQLDLTQMATILRRSTPSSLVLIDEFGKGTHPSSGIAVLTAALKKLARTKCKVICTTHFLEIFTLGLLRDGVDGIKAFQMAVHLPQSQDDGAAPLFKLENGVASSSAGLVCAKTAGVNKKVVARATEIITALREGRSVKPVKESMLRSTLTPAVKDALRMFLGVDSWVTASEQDLEQLKQKLAAI